jgi:hypothetical protein
MTAKDLSTVCQRLACGGHEFANVVCQRFACEYQAFANSLPVTANHLPTVCLSSRL